MTTNTVRVRYIGPQHDGLWSENHDFDHNVFVEVPVALALELLDRAEPAGETVETIDAETGEVTWVNPMAPIFELDHETPLPATTDPDDQSGSRPPRAPRVKKGR